MHRQLRGLKNQKGIDTTPEMAGPSNLQPNNITEGIPGMYSVTPNIRGNIIILWQLGE